MVEIIETNISFSGDFQSMNIEDHQSRVIKSPDWKTYVDYYSHSYNEELRELYPYTLPVWTEMEILDLKHGEYHLSCVINNGKFLTYRLAMLDEKKFNIEKKKCYKLDNYKGGGNMTLNTFDDILQFFFKCCNTEQAIRCSIWLNSRKDLFSVKDKIEETVGTKTSQISRVYRNGYLPINIRFKNGSDIEILAGESCIKGKRYTLSAFDGKIDDNFFENVIIPCSAGGFFPKQFIL